LAYYYKHHTSRGCEITDHNIFVIGAVIASYLFLFASFFVKKYVIGGTDTAKEKTAAASKPKTE
jgi:hypothetical protein